MEKTLTSQQIDDLREFFSAAMDVANYGTGDELALVRFRPNVGMVDREDRHYPYGEPTWEPATQVVRVVYIVHGGKFGVGADYCVMGIQRCGPQQL